MKRVYRGSTVVNIAALIFIIAAIKLSSSFLIPIVLAFFTSVLCAPIVIWLIKHKVPTALAIFVLFIFITIGIMGFVAIITQSINHFIAYLPQYDSLLSKKISWVVSIAHKYNINLSFVKAKLIDLMSNSNVLAYLKIAISQISSIVGNIVYLLLVIIFMLAEIPLLSKKINYISRLNTNSEAKIFQNISQIASGVIRYTVVKIIVGSLTGSLIFLLLSIIGIQNAAFWGLLAFLLNFIPNVGAFIAA
ncbi:MAG: AI-2E family transporter, partial [Psittacicella sp.]